MSKISKMFKVSSSSGSGSSSSRSKQHRSRAGPSPQEAIHRLRETEAMLAKKQEYLEQKIEQEITVAKKNGTKNKRAALQALKRKKRLEQQLTQIDGTLSTIEFQREALENASTNTEVLRTMSHAAKAIRGVHQSMDLDKIDSLMQDITEQQEVAQEICDAISRPFGELFDEDELLAELAELQEENMRMPTSKLPTVPTSKLPTSPTSKLPTVPTSKLPTVPTSKLPTSPTSKLPTVPTSKLPTSPTSKLPTTRHTHHHRTPSKKRVEHDSDLQTLAAWAT